MVCVNKFDLNADQTAAIEGFVKEKNIPIVGKVPFDNSFTKSMVQGKTIFEYDQNCELSKTIEQLWNRVGKYLETRN